MKVVNEYLAAKDGLTAGEMEEKIEGLVDRLQKEGVAVVTKEDVELLESAEQEEARAKNLGLQIHQRRKDARSYRRT
jgi:hypothetical protein